MSTRHWIVILLAGTAGFSTARVGSVTPVERQLAQAGAPQFTILDQNEEAWLALSAGPEHIRDRAGIFVYRRGGFLQARESGNGFNCIVERFGEPRVSEGFSPICYDAEGSKTRLASVLKRTQLREAGVSVDSVRSALVAAEASGEIRAPRHGVAYMLSTHFETRDVTTGKVTHFYPPHVMFYAPGLRTADLGTPDSLRNSLRHPWINGSGSAAHIVVSPVGTDTVLWKAHPAHGKYPIR